MFPLTRPQRQALATLAIVGLTVLPTGYVMLTAWTINRPGHVRDVEVAMGRELGLQVTLEGVGYPRPGEVVYRGLVLRHEEPRHKGLTEIARASLVRLHRGDRELILEAEGLKLRGESPKLALAQVGALLQRPAGGSIDRVSLAAPSCVLDLGHERLRFSLRDVAGTFQADRAEPTVRVSYRLVAKGSNTRCELVLGRDRKAGPVRTTVAIKSMDGLPLPAHVLDVFFDSADWLGPAARVDGAITLRQTGAKDWEADFQGDLIDVDLGALVVRRFPSHRLSGLARIAIKSARWGDRPGQGAGWIDASGEITCGQGALGLGLLRALASEMHFRPSPKVARLGPDASELEFESLGLSFAMTSDGEIRLGGALGSDFAPDAVLATQTSPLAYAPRGAANVRGLIKTLIPTNVTDPVMVPLTAESRVLLCFPAPAPMIAKRIEGN
jgi:hypothetical protein